MSAGKLLLATEKVFFAKTFFLKFGWHWIWFIGLLLLDSRLGFNATLSQEFSFTKSHNSAHVVAQGDC